MHREIEKNRHIIVFTDLDGTLLDHDTYSFDAAQEALQKIRSAQIPLIICTSKTRAEIEVWRDKLKNTDPFISENGGAIFLPKGMTIPGSYRAIERNGDLVIELGMHYSKLLVKFGRLKMLFGEKIRGFSDMDVKEVMHLTGLSKQEAERARKREYTEPFTFAGDENDIEELQMSVKALNLNLTRGGRFFHLLGDNDKGKAVGIVTEIYKRRLPHLETVALGDSFNDFPMLKTVDIPVLVQKPDGGYDEKINELPHLIRALGKGPAGWNKALLGIMEKLDNG